MTTANVHCSFLPFLGVPWGSTRCPICPAGRTTRACRRSNRLQQSRLVEWDSRGFVARYELILHTVYDRMNVARRAWVHGRVAAHLDGVNTPATSAELATHYHHARMRAHALRHAVAGARAAEKAGAFAEAAKLLASRQGRHRRSAASRPDCRPRRSSSLRVQGRRGGTGVFDRGCVSASKLRTPRERPGCRPPARRSAREQGLSDLRERRQPASVNSDAPPRSRGTGKAAAKAIDLELHIHRREGYGPEADRVAAHARALLERVAPGVTGSPACQPRTPSSG